MQHLRLLFIAFLLLLNLTSYSQTNKKIKILPVPSIGYSPETKTYVGAVSLFTLNLYQDSITRSSSAKLELNYSWNNQLIIESQWDYFFNEEKWFSSGKLSYSDYPDYYYGIGIESLESNEVLYDSKRIIFEISALKKIGKKDFLGPELKYNQYYKVKENNTSNYNELEDASVFGAGITFLHDSRNSLLTPTQGFYLKLSNIYNLSSSNYHELNTDVRYYKNWNQKYIWANRFYNGFRFGNPPFFDYSQLGGDRYVRGYLFGRYRDKNFSALQSEFRFPFYRRNMLAVFGGLSNIYSPENNFKLSNTMANYGIGMRFIVDKNDNTYLRLDYAIGQNNNSGFYISFGESF